MSNLRFLFIAALLVAMATIALSTDKFAVATGNWSATATWSLTRAGASGAPVPATTDSVIVPSGFTVTVDASAKTCLALNIESGGYLVAAGANPTSSQIYVRVYGWTVQNDGVIGYTAGAPTTMTPISFETYTAGRTLTLQGGGISKISRMRNGNNINNTTLVIDQDMTFTYTGSSGTGGVCWYAAQGTGTGHTFKVNSGRTVTVVDQGYIATNSSVDTDGPNTTFQIDGSLLMQGANSTMTLRPAVGATVTLTVNGTVDVGRTFKPTGTTGVASTITVNGPGQLKVGTAGSGGTCYFNSSSQTVTGTGSFILGANTNLQIGATAGLDATNGPIRTTTTTLPQGAKYEYNGTSAQVTGAQLPAEINGLSITNPAGLTLTNNLVVDSAMSFKAGTLSLGGKTFGYGTSVVRLTYADSLAVTTSDVEFPNDGKVKTLIINKTAAVIPANFGNVTLHAARTVDSLALTNGNLVTTGSNLLTLSATKAVPVSGGSATSFVNGPLAISYATAGGTFSMTYPIGKGAIYRPLTLSLTQAGATSSAYIAEMFNSAPAAYAFPGTLNPTEPYTVSKVRYYNIAEAAAGSTFTAGAVTLSYGADDGVTDMTNLRVAQGPGGGTWNDLGGAGTANTTGTITSTNYFTSLVSPDPGTIFTLANAITAGTNPLPVEMTSFTASMQNASSAILRWSTATEVNNNGFEIERRAELSSSWAKVGFVSGAGTSNSPKEYSFIDRALASGRYSYRLKQIDNDGSFKYHSTEAIVEVGVAPKMLALDANYPNPFNPTTEIRFSVPENGYAALKVYNAVGQEVATLFSGMAQAGYYITASFNGTKLSSGVYFARLEYNGKGLVQRMLMTK